MREMTVLKSRQDSLVKELRALLRDAKSRRESGRFAAEGARLCEDAASSGVRIVAAFATEDAAARYETQWRAVCAVAEQAFFIVPSLSDYLSDTHSPQGIFCLCQQRAPSAFAFEAGALYLALEDMQDPGNLGTAIRTAEAFGVKGLLLSTGCCDLYNPKVMRASMGGVFRLPVRVCPDFVGELRAASQAVSVLACVLSDDAIPATNAPRGGAVVLIGNEGNGLTADAVSVSTHRVIIPMTGAAESLNASMAAGILLWELSRDAHAEDV